MEKYDPLKVYQVRIEIIEDVSKTNAQFLTNRFLEGKESNLIQDIKPMTKKATGYNHENYSIMIQYLIESKEDKEDKR